MCVFPQGVNINIWVHSAKANFFSGLLFQSFFSFPVSLLFCILSTLGHLHCFFCLMQMCISLHMYLHGKYYHVRSRLSRKSHVLNLALEVLTGRYKEAKRIFSVWHSSASFSCLASLFRSWLGAMVDAEVF